MFVHAFTWGIKIKKMNVFFNKLKCTFESVSRMFLLAFKKDIENQFIIESTYRF